MDRETFASSVREYFSQLTVGCGRAQCANADCACAPQFEPMSPNSAAERAILLTRQHGRSRLCAQSASAPEPLPTSPSQPAVDQSIDLAAAESSDSPSGQQDDQDELDDTSRRDALIEDLTPPDSPLTLEEILSRTSPDVGGNPGKFSSLSRWIGEAFMDTHRLSGSFYVDEWRQAVARDESPLDFDTIREVHRKLSQCNTLDRRIEGSFRFTLESTCDELQCLVNNGVALLTRCIPLARVQNWLLFILESKFLEDVSFHDKALPALFRLICSLPESTRDYLSNCWSSHPSSLAHILELIQHFLTLRILMSEYDAPQEDPSVESSVRLLAMLHSANACSRSPLPYAAFYNDAVNESFDIVPDFTSMLREHFCFRNYPFLLNAQSKSEVMVGELEVATLQEQRRSFFDRLLSGHDMPYLIIRVRRGHVLRDTVVQLTSKTPEQCKKPLKVVFEGEEGVDEGGVRKEWFQLLVRELFGAEFGMFRENHETNTHWFVRSELDNTDEFNVVGLILGLAIYNAVILDVHFPLVVYRKLLGQTLTLEHLKDIRPSLASGLAKLLAFDEAAEGATVEDTFMCTFSVPYVNMFGETEVHDLKDNGNAISLTVHNRQEYVDLYVNFELNRSVERQFSAFKRGFDMVAKESLLQQFAPEEVQLLVVGSTVADFSELESVTVYDGGYTAESDVVRMFWAVVHEMSAAEQRLLLKFTTGSDRVPIGGLARMRFVVTKGGPDSNRLPSSHTCFNVLLLPEYTSQEKLARLLLSAIRNCEGFGML